MERGDKYKAPSGACLLDALQPRTWRGCGILFYTETVLCNAIHDDSAKRY